MFIFYLTGSLFPIITFPALPQWTHSNACGPGSGHVTDTQWRKYNSRICFQPYSLSVEEQSTVICVTL